MPFTTRFVIKLSKILASIDILNYKILAIFFAVFLLHVGLFVCTSDINWLAAVGGLLTTIAVLKMFMGYGQDFELETKDLYTARGNGAYQNNFENFIVDQSSNPHINFEEENEEHRKWVYKKHRSIFVADALILVGTLVWAYAAPIHALFKT